VIDVVAIAVHDCCLETKGLFKKSNHCSRVAGVQQWPYLGTRNRVAHLAILSGWEFKVKKLFQIARRSLTGALSP